MFFLGSDVLICEGDGSQRMATREPFANGDTMTDVTSFVAYFGDLASIAWPIVQRRPDLPWSAVRTIAQRQYDCDTFGQLRRTAAKTRYRDRVRYDSALHDSTYTEATGDSLEGIADRLPAAFVAAVRAGHDITESANIAGVSRATLYRKFAEIREAQ